MTWLPEVAPGATPFDRALGLCPELHADLTAFMQLFWRRRPVDPVILELCRVRIGQILGADPAPRPRLAGAALAPSAEQLAALDDWRTSPAFSEVERVCLRLAEQFVLDPHAVGDADVAAVATHLGPAATVALVEALALFDGFARFAAILGVAPAA
jgi:alkylhydroperoxidase family enzyme